MKMHSGETVIMMTLAIVRVSLIKLIMEIYFGIKMILTTLFLLKMSWMTMRKIRGGTVMMMNLSIVKVSPVELAIGIRNTFKNDTYYPLCAEGELDDDDEDEWRDGNDDESSDSEGKPR